MKPTHAEADPQVNAKVALVTGAAGGIGRAVAAEMARAGFAVAMVDVDPEALDRAVVEVAAEGQPVRSFAADITRESEVAGYIEQVRAAFGAPSVLVNNAGIEGNVRLVHEYSAAEFDRVWRVNLMGAWLNIKCVVPGMIRHGSGVVVNVASVAALRTSHHLAPYVASKHALLGLTRAAASDLAPYGIRVNAVCPGPVDTRMMASLEAQRESTLAESVGQASTLKSRVPLQRYARPTEIAKVVRFLASEESSYMTGADVVADGGLIL